MPYTETRQQHGLHPLLRMIENLGLGGWPLISSGWNGTVTWRHVARVMAQYGFPLFFDISVMPHPYNTSLDIIHVSNSPSRHCIQMKFQVLMLVTMKVTAIWVVTPYNLVAFCFSSSYRFYQSNSIRKVDSQYIFLRFGIFGNNRIS
jgi:hypothetical protein